MSYLIIVNVFFIVFKCRHFCRSFFHATIHNHSVLLRDVLHQQHTISTTITITIVAVAAVVVVIVITITIIIIIIIIINKPLSAAVKQSNV